MNEAAEFGAAAPGLVTRHAADARWNGAPSLVLPGAASRVGGGEQFFAVCILLLSSGAFVNLFPGEHGVEFEEQGLWFAQLLWAILFAAIIFIARKRFREVGRLAWDNKPFVLLLGWTCVSVIWSIDQQVTLRHFAALLASSFFGIYLALRYDLPGQLRLLSISLGIVIASSIVACVLFPDYAIDKTIVEEPAWQGVVSHKNALGKLAILAILILTLYLLKRRRHFKNGSGVFGGRSSGLPLRSRFSKKSSTSEASSAFRTISVWMSDRVHHSELGKFRRSSGEGSDVDGSIRPLGVVPDLDRAAASHRLRL
jgi:hypothetical protein